jgi:hypothetical protein
MMPLWIDQNGDLWTDEEVTPEARLYFTFTRVEEN